MKNRKRTLLLLLFPLILWSAEADTKIVDGMLGFTFRVESRNQDLLDSFYEYENNSNSQKVIEKGPGYIVVETKTRLSRLRTETPFPAGTLYADPAMLPYLDYSTSRKGIEITRGAGELVRREFVQKTPLEDREVEELKRRAEAITSGSDFQHQAVEKVMRYIRDNVSYSLRSSSNPVDVLRTGKAYCEGYANVAALLLRSVGIPTKVVDSYIPSGHMWGYGQEGGGGYHAHVEVYYQDAGWISYDPQATVHFVDPFHIVNYPRERTRLIQLEVVDNQFVTDVLPEPVRWDNFFQRDTSGERNSPILVGKIYRRDGRLVEDSFRTSQWVYVRKEDGSGEGVRVLSNGEFILSPYMLPREQTELSFFYRDGLGGWIEETVEFTGKERVERIYCLDRPETGFQIDTGRAGGIYLWYRSTRGWKLDQLSAGRDSVIRLISSAGKWIVSSSRQDTAAKYLLDTELLSPGRVYTLEELPRYLDPEKYYLEISRSLPFSLQFIDIETSRRYAPIQGEDKNTIYAVPDISFSTLAVKRAGVLEIFSIDTNLKKGESVSPYQNGGARRIRIQADRAGTQVYLAVKRGNSYAEVIRGRTDDKGELTLIIDRATLGKTGGDLFILSGNPPGSQRTPVAEIEGGVLRLD